MDDEPLSRWAERRDARIGQLRAVPLVTGDGPRASHLNPEAPRAIQRWNGHLWEPYGFAANLAEARLVLFPRAEADSEPSPAPAATPRLGPGTGRHRKPPAP
ncbi:DUF6087 family protein [Streptomyces sp. NPDC057197]|uniref:DUF6087 family protein n=1 Tax=Streptomyces sp. NPDC057197 TaxID=3346045 RepID=UPI00363F86F2